MIDPNGGSYVDSVTVRCVPVVDDNGIKEYLTCIQPSNDTVRIKTERERMRERIERESESLSFLPGSNECLLLWEEPNGSEATG